MGVMRFVVSPAEVLTEETLAQTYLAGIEGIPSPVRVRREQDVLILERQVSESANLYFPWQVPGHPRLLIATASLMERAEPYRLPLELARGKLSQVRNQLAEWQSLGLAVPAELPAQIAEAVDHLSRAAVEQSASEQSAAAANESLRASLDACQLLATCYSDQVFANRRRGTARLETSLGADLGSSPLDDYSATQFVQSFNAARIPILWRNAESVEGVYCWTVPDAQLDWCREHHLSVYVGPLLRFDAGGVPDWLSLWSGDFENLFSFVSDYIRAVASRYRGRVDYWQCAARLNTPEALELSQEEHLRLAARAIEILRQIDPQTPVLVSFDQPWAEYLARRKADFPPLQLADALVRAGLGLGGLMLEMNVGFHPGGTLSRDVLELSRRLDQWATLGMPLHVALCVPSAANADPLALRRTRVASSQWTPQAQQAWVAQNLPLILAKPFVEGLLWGQLRDSEPHEFPHAGLFDVRRHAKPALRTVASLRRAHFK